ncbi:cupin domain-containing protein [Streptomyces sp. TG1A-8]|nr:cupin domain-containing protein [Streptomyces sp. TG1A-8]MDO0924195.1 cupin domain-containing protein [Streptomyces sp. TG1A-8]
MDAFWNKKHGLFKNASPVAGMLDETAIQEILDVGLLRWPYFMLLKEGIQPAISDFTRTRNVRGQSVSGFADAKKVRKLLDGGATMKLSQLEDWHLPTRQLMDEIESRLPAELKAYIFYTPCDNTGMLPHRDPSHVLALQIAGAKEWRIYDAPDKVDSRGGLLPDLDADSHSHSFVMEPGDVLYLPHGIPHVATARTGTSLHLTLTITEPAPLELVESLMEGFGDEADRLDSLTSGISTEDKAEAVTSALLDHLDRVDPEALVNAAVMRMRNRRA